MIKPVRQNAGSLSLGGPPYLERFKLMGLLNSLPPAVFNHVVFALNPPAGMVAPRDAPQGDRTFDLLQWLESPAGPGLATLRTLLAEIPGLDIDQPPPETYPRCRITLDVDATTVDIHRLQELMQAIGNLVGDRTLRIVDVNEGSLVIDVSGDLDALQSLQRQIEQGQFSRLFVDREKVDHATARGRYLPIVKAQYIAQPKRRRRRSPQAHGSHEPLAPLHTMFTTPQGLLVIVISISLLIFTAFFDSLWMRFFPDSPPPPDAVEQREEPDAFPPL